jgi:hypothetical protein
MNKKEFAAYLHQPGLIDKQGEVALQEVVADFPYFQAAQQLLLKAHQNNGSYHFEKQLPITSLLHGNRALLYAYLRDRLVREFVEEVKEEDKAEVKVQAGQEDMPFQNFGDKYQSEKVKEENTTEAEKEEILVHDLSLEDIQEPEAKVEVKIEEEDLPFQNFDKKYVEKEVEEKVEVVDEVKVEEKAEIRVEEVREMEEKVISEIEPHDFLTWLKAKKSHQLHEPPPKESESESESGSEEKDGGEKKIRKFNALIDKFIESSPSISKPEPTKFYNPAQKAKESITENFDLVTETLARIYIKQSNYKKAILVYEKLSLLYPEKISYFAAQISELKTLLNK